MVAVCLRGDYSSSAIVFLKPSNRYRSTCSCHGFGTNARASGELHLAPDGHCDGVTSTNRGSTRTSCGVHPGRANVSDCTCDSDRDWRRHEQGRHSRRVATASGWLHRDERRCHIRGGSRLVWLAGYLVKFQIQDVLKLTVRGFDIPRTAEELSTLDSQIRLRFPFSVPGSLNAYINVFMTTDTLWTSQLFKDMTTLPTVFDARLPAFRSVLPKLQSREEVYLEDETSFECWLYVNTWDSHHGDVLDHSVAQVVRHGGRAMQRSPQFSPARRGRGRVHVVG